MRWRASLVSRLFLAFVVVVLAGWAAAGLTLVVFASIPGLFPNQALTRVLKHLALELAELPPGEPLRLAVEGIRDELGADTAVITEEGIPIAAAGEPLPGLSDGDIAAALEGTTVFWRLRPTIGAPMRLQDGRRAVLHVRAIAAATGVHERPFHPFVFAVLVLILGVVWMLRLARAITRPVRRLSEVAEAFGQGNLEVRARPAAVEELTQLANAFNNMADRIAISRRKEKELLANLSHELRTPLGRLRMLLGLLDLPDKSAQARVREMEMEIEELDGLISDLLTTSRLELGPQNIRREPVDLEALAQRSRRRLSMIAPGRDVAVSVAPYTFASGDERLLGRVIDNLLENAHKYSPRGSGIRVNGRRVSEERVQLSVEDEGTAIPEAEREQIFQAFVRGSGSGDLDGHGLGLSLARKVVEAHGGVIRVVQRTLRGNRFELELPAAEGTP